MLVKRRRFLKGLCLSAWVCAPVNDLRAADAAPSIYGAPQQTAPLPSGRSINYFCMGEGSPTVILTAGLGDITFTWEPIHARLAETTRVCAWDRAGHGFSDASPEPQDALNTTADLQAWLTAADVTGPYVLVGHSMGGFETLLFADRHREDVVGIVMVDAAHPHQEAAYAEAAPRAFQGLISDEAAEDEAGRACVARIRASGRQERCLGKPPETLTGRRAEVADVLLDRWSDPDSVENQLSLLREFAVSASQAAVGLRNFDGLPLVVLTATRFGLPSEFADEEDRANQAKLTLARSLASLSGRGVHRVVADSGHYIHHDQPDEVIASINEVVATARERSGPQPRLRPSPSVPVEP